MGRGRLTREARLRQEHPCRGLLLSTGETTIEGEASVLSRMLVVEVPPWERRDPGGRALAQADAGTLSKELAARFEANTKGFRDKLSSTLGRKANTGRMVQNWAVLAATFQILSRYLRELNADESLPNWQDAIVETVKLVQQERAGQLFLNILAQLLASGRVTLGRNMREPEEPRPGTAIIGYQHEQHVYCCRKSPIRR